MTQEPSVHLDECPLLQKCIYNLEAYKRRLGRNFDKATAHVDKVYFFNRYNECENVIQMMCDKYHLDRKSKPHKLNLEVLK